ncbi:MAG: DNRLRE domain-containing protein [Polyangiales bacterium]
MRHAVTPRRRAVLVAFALLAAGTPVGAYRLEDTLRGATRGNVVGGAVMADGWHVTDRRDRVWYALPRLVSGSAEFTVTGLTMDRLGDTFDNELFAMYEAGHGIAEPISYSAFRENHYKCMIRVYGNGEAGRQGFQKLMWGMCPSGAPGYGACGCASFFEEPFAGPGAWDGTPQRMRVEWGAGATRLLRNGRVVTSVDWSRSGLTFGPAELHLSLGTSRPSAVDTAQLPVGIVFSDLVVEGTEGPLGVCPGATMSDAGSPDAPPPVMSGDTLELPAVEDVTVAPSSPTAVYPDVRDLSVGAGDSEFYVKFRVPALRGRVVRAQLVLQSATIASARGTGASVFRAASDAWSESTLTWNARPGPTGARLARVDGIAPDGAYVFDLPATSVSGEGVAAFAVVPEAGDADSAHFDAREVSASRGPRLRLTVDPTMASDAAVVPDVTAPVDAARVIDVPLPDAATRPDAFVALDVMTDDVPPARDATLDRPELGPDEGGYGIPPSDGCSCRAAGRAAGRGERAAGWFALLVLGAWARRRRDVVRG